MSHQRFEGPNRLSDKVGHPAQLGRVSPNLMGACRVCTDEFVAFLSGLVHSLLRSPR